MSVFDCTCYDAETGKLLLKLITTVEAMPPEDLPEGLDPKRLKELKIQIKTCGFDGQQGKSGGGDGKTSKKGRKLSGYQIAMGNCMRSPEKGGQGKPFMECISDWKAKKNG